MIEVHSRPVAICVPVRNEAVLLPRLLDALAVQRGLTDVSLCLFFDDCTDDSAAVVADRESRLPFPVVTACGGPGPPRAGLARRRAMALGMAMLPPGGVLISTDADSAPAPDWLAANLSALRLADIALGRVTRTDGRSSPLQDRIDAYYDTLFALRRAIDPVAWEAPRTHHFTSGASFAFRVDAYRALGGFAALPSAEDARMVDAAHRAGLRVRRDAAIRVTTSARRVGRAAGGMADHLRALDEGEHMAVMAHPDDAAWRYRRHAMARALWPDLTITARVSLAAALACDVGHIDRVAADAVNAEAFATRVVPEVPGGERIVPLDVAEAALARLLDEHETIAA